MRQRHKASAFCVKILQSYIKHDIIFKYQIFGYDFNFVNKKFYFQEGNFMENTTKIEVRVSKTRKFVREAVMNDEGRLVLDLERVIEHETERAIASVLSLSDWFMHYYEPMTPNEVLLYKVLVKALEKESNRAEFEKELDNPFSVLYYGAQIKRRTMEGEELWKVWPEVANDFKAFWQPE